MTNEADRTVIREWMEGRVKDLKKASVRAAPDGTLMLWSTEVGRLVRGADGQERGLAILNGDQLAGTNGYQAEMRALLRTKEIPFVIVPYEATAAAGILTETIRPVHVESERFESILHREDEPPATMVAIGRSAGYSLRFGDEWYRNDVEGARQGDIEGLASIRKTKPGAELVGIYRQTGDLRWFDQLVIRHRGKYEWHHNRHWLGDSVFTATVDPSTIRRRGGGPVRRTGPVRHDVPFISSFDRQESRTLYFLSELPRHAIDLDDALESLKPESVRFAEEAGLVVTRQGDMFGIPMPGVTKRDLAQMGASFTTRKIAITLSEGARRNVDTARRLEKAAAKVGRPAPSRTDENGMYRNWQTFRALEGQWEREVAAHYTLMYPNMPPIYSGQVRGWLNYRPNRWDRERAVEQAAPIYGTAHTASEVATLPGGVQLGRGCLYHEPTNVGENREADHARRKLGDGKQWHVLVRNTVPLQG